MKLIKAFDPSATPLGGTLDTLGANVNEQLMLYNDSPYALELAFQDGSVDVIPASWNKDFIMPHVIMGKVKWTIYNQLTVTNYPISQVYGTLYEADEHVARVNAAMQRGVTVSNVGGLPVTANSIANDGNNSGDVFIESTVAGQGSSSVSISNDAIVNLSLVIAGALVRILKTQDVDPLIQIGALGYLMEVLGALTVDQQLTVGGITSLDAGNITTDGAGIMTFPFNKFIQFKDSGGVKRGVLICDSSNNFVVRAPGGNIAWRSISNALWGYIDGTSLKIAGRQIDDTAGNNLWDAASGGLYLKGDPTLAGPAHFQSDGVHTDWTWTAVNRFSGTGTGTFNHGLTYRGAAIKPDIIIPIQNVAGSQTMGYDDSSMTSTQVHIQTGAGLAWTALAVKVS